MKLCCNPVLIKLTDGLGVAGRRVQQHAEALQELLEGVADGEARLPDLYRLHHPGVAQLTHAQVPVEELHTHITTHTHTHTHTGIDTHTHTRI